MLQPEVIIPLRASSTVHTPRIQPENISKIVSNRVNSQDLEQFLVVWAGKYGKSKTPLSWHSINELSDCLWLVQEYLDDKTRFPPTSRKRKSPDSDLSSDNHILNPVERRIKQKSRSSSVVSSTSDSSRSLVVVEPESRDPDVYNGVHEVKDGFIRIKASTERGVDRINSEDVPTPAMVSRARSSSTSTAEDRIRMEVIHRLRELAGPSVTLLNKIDRSSPPLRFQFIKESILGEGVEKADPATMTGCQKCRPHMGQNIGCEYTRKCDCLEYAAVDVKRLTDATKPIYNRYLAGNDIDLYQLPKRFPYFSHGNNTGCLVPFYLNERHAIYECNRNCMCGPGCKNRVVQHGRQVELIIFKTPDRGWGLKCKQRLRQGEFIDTYRGEIITDAEATRREQAAVNSKNSYLYSLDKFAESQGLQQEDMYLVDGECFGGPTRFMNHSCEPNCRQYTVSYNKHDVRVYEIAFFAYRDIEPGEELTFDYLDKDEEEDDEAAPPASPEKTKDDAQGGTKVECRCGAKKCRKWLWM